MGEKGEEIQMVTALVETFFILISIFRTTIEFQINARSIILRLATNLELLNDEVEESKDCDDRNNADDDSHT